MVGNNEDYRPRHNRARRVARRAVLVRYAVEFHEYARFGRQAAKYDAAIIRLRTEPGTEHGRIGQDRAHRRADA